MVVVGDALPAGSGAVRTLTIAQCRLIEIGALRIDHRRKGGVAIAGIVEALIEQVADVIHFEKQTEALPVGAGVAEPGAQRGGFTVAGKAVIIHALVAQSKGEAGVTLLQGLGKAAGAFVCGKRVTAGQQG